MKKEAHIVRGHSIEECLISIYNLLYGKVDWDMNLQIKQVINAKFSPSCTGVDNFVFEVTFDNFLDQGPCPRTLFEELKRPYLQILKPCEFEQAIKNIKKEKENYDR